tara:strand:+ start:971 stop:1291 length:321 start_codon:yes stop_codon:yes gene_type:complete
MFNLRILLYLFLPFLIWGCQSLSEVGKVMRNEKTNSNDEFLVKQKEPLTLPPDFAEIPEPGALEKKTKEEKEKNTIEKAFRIDKEKSNKKPRSGSVEESILKRIDK